MPLTTVSPGMLDTTAQYYSFKNRIINGAMVIDQRNAGASVTPTTNGTYTLDRFKFFITQASKFSTQQNAGSVTPPTGYKNYLGVTSLSSYSVVSSDYFSLVQCIEDKNFADFAWGTASPSSITISFWVRSSLTGTFGASLTNYTGSRSYPFTYSISSANTWEQKSVTIAGDTDSSWATTSGLNLCFGLGVGATFSGTAGAWVSANYVSATGATSVVGTNGATFYITGVQLEKGSTATSFDYRPYGTELALCQRYCQKFTVFPSGSFDAFMGYFGGSNALSSVKRLTTPMRGAPTASFTNGAVQYYSFGGAWTNTNLVASILNTEMYYIYCASDADGRSKLMRNGNAGLDPDPVVTFSAEL